MSSKLTKNSQIKVDLRFVFKKRTNSQIEKSERQNKTLYIRTSCEYLTRRPLTARSVIAVIFSVAENFSSRHSKRSGTSARIEKKIGKSLSHKSDSLPAQIQNFSQM